MSITNHYWHTLGLASTKLLKGSVTNLSRWHARVVCAFEFKFEFARSVSPTFNFSGENTYLSLRTWSSQEIVQGGQLLSSKFHMCSQEAAVMSSGL